MRALLVISAFSLAVACTDPPSPTVSDVKPDPVALPPAGTAAPAATPAAPGAKKRTNIEGYNAYDATLDGQKQIDDAAKKAKAENKRVLVMFGGNWCKWCKALDGLFAEHAAVKAALDKGYVLLHVDSETNGKLDAALGNPFANGFPVLVVMDGDGKKLHIQETGSLEVANAEGQPVKVAHDPDKVLAFLQKWSP